MPWELEIAGPREFPALSAGNWIESPPRGEFSDRVRWAGYVPYGKPLFDRMRAADIFVLPTLSEGTPHVLVEARANGLPCISTTVGGVPTRVTDGFDALLVPPKESARFGPGHRARRSRRRIAPRLDSQWIGVGPQANSGMIHRHRAQRCSKRVWKPGRAAVLRNRDERMRVLQYLWFHFIALATCWLPDLRPFLRLRGFVLRPAFKTCGRNFQMARRVTINFTNRLEIGSDVYIATGCWLNARGGIVIGGRSATWTVRGSGYWRPHRGWRVIPERSQQFGANPLMPGIVGRCTRHRHQGCDHWSRRFAGGKFRGDTRHSAMRSGGWRARACNSTKDTDRARCLKLGIG